MSLFALLDKMKSTSPFVRVYTVLNSHNVDRNLYFAFLLVGKLVDFIAELLSATLEGKISASLLANVEFNGIR